MRTMHLIAAAAAAGRREESNCGQAEWSVLVVSAARILLAGDQ